jgi:hypothetical protein
MLLVTFHGSTGGINNVFGFSTSGKPGGKPETEAALSVPKGVTLDELRAMAIYGGNLYVVSGGGGGASSVLVFQGPPKKGPQFDYLDTVIAEGQSIMHPFGIAFEPGPLPTNCYVSNQDSNVVAQVSLVSGKNGAVNGALGSGCQSTFLTTQYANGAFLDGTFVASQIGNLKGLAVDATPVSEANGGLGVTCKKDPSCKKDNEPDNSVRDVAIANGILFVCDEVDSRICMYNLAAGQNLGAPLTPGSVTGSPTHLAIYGGGLWVSAGESLYWSALPASASGASLSFQSIAIKVPSKNKIGGISFDDAGNVYVVFQEGTGGTGSGSIAKYAVKTGTPPSLSNEVAFATLSADTPEFCLWVSDSNWPS